PIDVEFGDTELEPEVVMSMEADTAHRFWLGQVNVTTALARGQIHASGPVAKILKLVPLTKPAFPRYKALLETQGRDDLVKIDWALRPRRRNGPRSSPAWPRSVGFAMSRSAGSTRWARRSRSALGARTGSRASSATAFSAPPAMPTSTRRAAS